MKIIGTSNFNIESEADSLIAENIKNKEMAQIMADALNDKYCNSSVSPTHYIIVDDDHRLSRGMADLI